MPGNFRKDDLRIIRTYKALLEALQRLLAFRTFYRLTVNDLCEEAQLSRTAFYTHFKDKYDLLEYWLTSLKSEMAIDGNDYDDMEEKINNLVRNHTKAITNLLENADNTTVEVMQRVMLSFLNIPVRTEKNGTLFYKYIVVTNFCIGGILNCLTWQIKNRFPPDLQMMNSYFYTILKILLES